VKRIRVKEIFKRLLHIEDTPERTALAFGIGVFLGFSPFLGLHTLAGLAVAFLFRLNRPALLLGVWTNLPWLIIPYYSFATWVGMWLTGYGVELSSVRELLRVGLEQGLLGREFWDCLSTQWGFLWSFTTGSLALSLVLGLAAHVLCLKAILFYRRKRSRPSP
jgi:uncharacterized protein